MPSSPHHVQGIIHPACCSLQTRDERASLVGLISCWSIPSQQGLPSSGSRNAYRRAQQSCNDTTRHHKSGHFPAASACVCLFWRNLKTHPPQVIMDHPSISSKTPKVFHGTTICGPRRKEKATRDTISWGSPEVWAPLDRDEVDQIMAGGIAMDSGMSRDVHSSVNVPPDIVHLCR